ncbi:MAG: PIN domain-containing protein [Defluviitaleaceae bacterium]|nr:PIN domain-containing protein [Defluviitaleaceae bacterium]MCL2263234.1 PIN domain-containing protein [Defluviitaleaceae bacterium]
MTHYVLDACALMAVLYGEKGASVVKAAFDEADKGTAKIIMHKANLLEVYYDLFRALGKDKADVILSEIKKRSIDINSEISDEFFAVAGRLKATYKISFADSFVLAQSLISGGALLTADHHEFDVIESAENITFAWVR